MADGNGNLTWKQIGTLGGIGVVLLAAHTALVLPSILAGTGEQTDTKIAQHSESESGPHQTLNGRLGRLERQVEKLSETVATKKDLDRLYQQIRDMIYRSSRDEGP